MERVGALDEDCEGLVNYALAIQGVEVAAFFREQADGRFASACAARGGGCNRGCRMFGGGGPAAPAAARRTAAAHAIADVIGRLRTASIQ